VSIERRFRALPGARAHAPARRPQRVDPARHGVDRFLAMTTQALFGELTRALEKAALDVYGDRLTSLVVFGSVGRGTARPDSDRDVLLVVDPLPDGRMARVAEFLAVEERLAPVARSLGERGLVTKLSPVFKTRAAATRGSPLFLDMVEMRASCSTATTSSRASSPGCAAVSRHSARGASGAGRAGTGI